MPLARNSDVEVHFESYGSGPAVIIIDGWGVSTGPALSTLAQRLAEQFTVVVYDHRGLGDSRGPLANLSSTELAKDAALVVRASGISDQYSIVGEGGLGAAIAQHLAHDGGEAISKLVLSAGWAAPEPYHLAQQRSLYRILQHCGWDAYLELAAVFCQLPESVNADGVFSIESWDAAGSVSERTDELLNIMNANMTHDARPILPLIDAETLVIAGELDQLGAPRLALELHALIRNSELKILRGHPHDRSRLPNQLEEYITTVIEFLTRG